MQQHLTYFGWNGEQNDDPVVGFELLYPHHAHYTTALQLESNESRDGGETLTGLGQSSAAKGMGKPPALAMGALSFQGGD